MKIMKKDIRANDQVTTFFALESMLRTSRNKNNFLELTFHDRTGKGYLWNDPVVMSAVLKEKTIVKVKANVSLYNDSLILNVEKIRQAAKDEFNMNDFMEVVAGGPGPSSMTSAKPENSFGRSAGNTPQRAGSWAVLPSGS